MRGLVEVVEENGDQVLVRSHLGEEGLRKLLDGQLTPGYQLNVKQEPMTLDSLKTYL